MKGLRTGDRVRVMQGIHRGEEGTVFLVIHIGLEVILDEAGWVYLYRDDVEQLITVNA